MIHILLISHGEMCKGLLNTIEMVVGQQEGLTTLSLVPGEEPKAYRKRLEAEIVQYETKEGVLILADIKGGTPFNSAVYLGKIYKVGIVTGINLPVAISLILERGNGGKLDDLLKLAALKEAYGIEGIDLSVGRRSKREKLSINKN